MPNVRHEESLEGMSIPEFTQGTAMLPPAYQEDLKEDTTQKCDSCTYRSQYRED